MVTHAVAEQTADSPSVTPDERKKSHSYYRNVLRVFSLIGLFFLISIISFLNITIKWAILNSTPGIYECIQHFAGNCLGIHHEKLIFISSVSVSLEYFFPTELRGCTIVTLMSKCWSLFLGTCRTCCWVHCTDDIEASKFTNLASIRVSMGTSQSACDGDDVCSKAKSLMMLLPISHAQTWSIYFFCKKKQHG